MKDGITPAALFRGDYPEVLAMFKDWCKSKNLQPSKRKARTWLKEKGFRYIRKVA